MKIFAALMFLALLAPCFATDLRRVSPGDTTYYINPATGDDAQGGLTRGEAWRTFEHLNRLRLAPGDRVEILSAGELTHSLSLSGSGTAEKPIEVRFAPGRYDVLPARLHREAWQISNTNGDPDTPKAVALHIHSASHVRISGKDARLVSRGKMIHVCIDGSEGISIEGLAFDYHRPTVSEFSVVEAGAGFAVIDIHRDSTYRIEDGHLTWTGEGWHLRDGLVQELDPASGRVRRVGFVTRGLSATEMSPFRVRLEGGHRFKQGAVYQVRDQFRDCAGVFIHRSRQISWKDVKFHFLHGMGIVSQFSENLAFESVSVAPDPASGRTTAAWADCIHFSGCRGRILVKDCEFSGAHDDAINVHGTHLRIVANPEPNKVRARFMHPQTFGFMAFHSGDEVDFVHADTLAIYARNRVLDARMIDPREMELTLEKPLPTEWREHDVLENVTWTPQVEIRGCKVSRIPTRGFLVTTRQPVLIEDNVFHATHMSAILIENDAEGWFESGCVRDMTIRRNRFLECGEPVVKINPRNSKPNAAVHRNIRILDNEFILRGGIAVEAHGTTGLRIAGNIIRAASITGDTGAIRTHDCQERIIEGNSYHGR